MFYQVFKLAKVGTLYHPPWAKEKSLQQKTVDYLINTLDMIRLVSPQMGLVLHGDFNLLPIKMLKNFHLDMKQVVKENTWGNSILDLIITNLHSFYRPPTALPHNCLMVSSNSKSGVRRDMKWKLGMKERRPWHGAW